MDLTLQLKHKILPQIAMFAVLSEDGRIMRRLSSVNCIKSYVAEDFVYLWCQSSRFLDENVIQNHCKAFDTPHQYLKQIISGAMFA